MIRIDQAVFAFVLTCSLILNTYLFFRLRKKPKRGPSIELREFISDLAGGGAMAAFLPTGEVKRIDDSQISLRSPKPR